MDLRKWRPGALFLAAAALGPALLGPAPLPAQQRLPSEQVAVLSPERTDAGEWMGTWYFKTRQEKWALWIRETDGVPELQFQFQNYDDGENFKTDWRGSARYAADKKKGHFELTFHQRDADLIRGDWYWQLGTPGEDALVRTETAEFEIYRASRGRQLVLRFDGFERVYDDNGKLLSMTAPQAWTFHKASRRLVRWQELPF